MDEFHELDVDRKRLRFDDDYEYGSEDDERKPSAVQRRRIEVDEDFIPFDERGIPTNSPILRRCIEIESSRIFTSRLAIRPM